MIHKRRAKQFYTALKKVASNKDDVAIGFDYMQNPQLPLIFVEELFYLQHLWVNIFCIHDLKTNKVKLYIYHEEIANKAIYEVCSFLLNYINTLIAKVTKHLLFSDGAAGQN